RDLAEGDLADATDRLLDDVVRTDTDATARDDEVGTDQLVLERVDELARVVRHDADPERDRAGFVRGGREQRAVRVGDLPGGQRLPGLDQLAAGGQYDD